MHLVPWLLLVAASIFAVSGPVSRALERLETARQSTGECATRMRRAALPLFLWPPSR